MEMIDDWLESGWGLYERFRTGEFAPVISWDRMAALLEAFLFVAFVLTYFILSRRRG